MGEPEYVDPITERVVAVMHERGLSSEDDFLRVKDKLLAARRRRLRVSSTRARLA